MPVNLSVYRESDCGCGVPPAKFDIATDSDEYIDWLPGVSSYDCFRLEGG